MSTWQPCLYMRLLQIIYAGKVLREDSLCVKDFLRPVSARVYSACNVQSSDNRLLTVYAFIEIGGVHRSLSSPGN